MAFMVNSSPGAGLRFEQSATIEKKDYALFWAIALARRGMRLVRIRDIEGGVICDERGLSGEIKHLHLAS